MSVNNVKDNKCFVPVQGAIKARHAFEIDEILSGGVAQTVWQDSNVVITDVAVASLQTNAYTALQIMTYTQNGVVGVVVYNTGQSTYQNIVVNVAVL